MSLVDSRYARLIVIDSDTIISRSLRLYGEWAQAEIDGLAPFILKGDSVIDVGAFIGTHAIAFSSLVGPTGSVLAFEPHKVIYTILQENIHQAPFPNVTARHCALGATEASVLVRRFKLAKEANFGGLSLREPIDPNDASEKVTILPLDALSVERVDFLKADVEGMEIEVLSGGEKTIARCRPVIFAECNSLGNSMPLLEWSRNHGYLPFGFTARAFNPQNFKGNSENVFGDSSETGILLLPNERFDKYAGVVDAARLPPLKTVDDLALVLLHKPQYPYEVLAQTATGALLGINYPSNLALWQKSENGHLAEQLAERDSLLSAVRADLTEPAALKVVEQATEIAALQKSGTEQVAAIEARDAQIEALSNNLARREAKVHEQLADIAALKQYKSENETALQERDSRLATLAATVAEQQAKVLEQSVTLASLTQYKSEQEVVAREREAQIAQLTSSLTEQAAEIASLTESNSEQAATLDARDSRIALLASRLTEQEATVAELSTELATMKQAGFEHGIVLEQRESRIAGLVDDLARRDAKVSAQSAELASLKRSKSEWDAILEERDLRINLLTGNLAKRDARIGQLSAEISALKRLSSGETKRVKTEQAVALATAWLGTELTSLREKQALYSLEIERLQLENGKVRELARDQSGTIENLKTSADTLRQTIEAVGQTAETLRQTINGLEMQLAERNNALMATRAQLEGAIRDRAELLQLVEGLSESVSWRVTAPLRGAKRTAARMSRSPAKIVAQGERLFEGLWRSTPEAPPASAAPVYEVEAVSTDVGTAMQISPVPADVAPAALIAAPPLHESISFPDVSDPVVSVVIAVYNKLKFTVDCLKSIYLHMPQRSIEVVVVDDGSRDETSAVVSGISGLRYVRNVNNVGFLRSANRGAAVARGHYLYFLNNDTELQDSTIDSLVDVFKQMPDVAIAGSKLVYPSGHLQEAGAVLNTDGTVELVGLNSPPDMPQYNFLREVDYCSGASLMIERARFEALGGFDDDFAPAYFEDADLSLRVRQSGGRIIYQPASAVLHHLSITTNDHGAGKAAMIERNKLKFLDRWQSTLDESNKVRLIAFYLPQYHTIPENDAWWGKGFTEWTNVSKARPSFPGHHQPQVPDSLGYYDLRSPEARQAQATLAQEHGVHGFCYYYYWFGGKRLLQEPLEQVLKSGEPRFPFCVCWANETWSRRWDGRDSDVLMEQTYSPEDDVAFIESLFPLFSDERYIRINGRPVLLIYRADKLPNAKCTVDRWRRACAKAGIADPYLVRVGSFLGLSDHNSPADLGFDAAVEFPPHGLAVQAQAPPGTSPDFQGMFFDYFESANRFRSQPIPPYRLFKSVMPSWDNTARRGNAAHVFINSEPVVYENWLRDAIETTRRFAVGDERIVFINAWNEWAEGNHLEPDVRYGRAFLQATKRAWEKACGLKLAEPR